MTKSNNSNAAIAFPRPEFSELLDASIYTIQGASNVLEVGKHTISSWIREEKPATPNDENKEKVLKFMSKLRRPESKRMKKHPSYGYATEAEIKRLKEIGICPEYKDIMEKIEKRTKAEGKTK